MSHSEPAQRALKKTQTKDNLGPLTLIFPCLPGLCGRGEVGSGQSPLPHSPQTHGLELPGVTEDPSIFEGQLRMNSTRWLQGMAEDRRDHLGGLGIAAFCLCLSHWSQTGLG